jgi:hypothetical protein
MLFFIVVITLHLFQWKLFELSYTIDHFNRHPFAVMNKLKRPSNDFRKWWRSIEMNHLWFLSTRHRHHLNRVCMRSHCDIKNQLDMMRVLFHEQQWVMFVELMRLDMTSDSLFCFFDIIWWLRGCSWNDLCSHIFLAW